MLRVASIFSGVGTPELALKSLETIPFKTVFACEINKYARQTYLKNNKHPKIFYKDVKQINGTYHKNQIDLFVGGSPCQAFSIAGKRGGFEDTRGTLFFEYAQLVKEIQPSIFVFENVKGMINHDKGRTFKTIMNTFEDLNYQLFWQVLNTKDYGVPQNRERLYVVGFKKPQTDFSFKPKQELKLKLKDMLDEQVEDKYYLNSTQVHKRFNSTFNQEKASLMAYEKEFSRTLIAQGTTTGVQTHQQKDIYRLLTPREYFRLQGFSEDFKFPEKVSNTQLYIQAGNAMSQNVLEMIFTQIYKGGIT